MKFLTEELKDQRDVIQAGYGNPTNTDFDGNLPKWDLGSLLLFPGLPACCWYTLGLPGNTRMPFHTNGALLLRDPIMCTSDSHFKVNPPAHPAWGSDREAGSEPQQSMGGEGQDTFGCYHYIGARMCISSFLNKM